MVGGGGGIRAREPLFEMRQNITLVGDNGAGRPARSRTDHRRAEHRGGRRSAAVRRSFGVPTRSVCAGADGRLRRVAHPRVHGARMTKRTFDPGFRIELHQKDLNLALDGARKLGLALPHAARSLFSVCASRRQGMGSLGTRARSRSCRTSRSARRRPRNTAATMRVLLRWRTRATNVTGTAGRIDARLARITVAPALHCRWHAGRGEKPLWAESGVVGSQRHPATPGSRSVDVVVGCPPVGFRVLHFFTFKRAIFRNRRRERLHFRHAFRENRRASVHLR